MSDKLTVIARKSKETLELFSTLWNWPFTNRLNLIRVFCHARNADNMPQVDYTLLAKMTLG